MMTDPTISAAQLQLQQQLDAVLGGYASLKPPTNTQVPAVLSDDDSTNCVEDANNSSSNNNNNNSNINNSPAHKSKKSQSDGAASDNGTSSYRDFSRVAPEKQNGASSLIAQSTTAKEPTFPVKLHMILSNPDYQDIIAWLPHGRSWRILQQKAFEDRVIPLYFRHGRYSSFARQVNGWGFRRITHGSDYNSYYHELFLRGLPHLCDRMRRLTSKDISKRKKTDEEPAPDFYALSRENPLPESSPLPTSNGATSPTFPNPSTSPVPMASLPMTSVPGIAGGGVGAPGMSMSSMMPASAAGTSAGAGGICDVDLALLERRKQNLLDRMKYPNSANGIRPEAMTSSAFTLQDMNAAAAAGIGGFGSAGLTGLGGTNSVSMQHSFMGGVPNVGGLLNSSPEAAALQRQMLGARLAHTDVANILGLNNASNGVGGMRPGLMGNPFGI